MIVHFGSQLGPITSFLKQNSKMNINLQQVT